MPGSRSGTLRHVDVEADLALARHLRRRGGQAGGAEVLERDQQLAVEQLQRALEQLLLLERVADLDRRAASRRRPRPARRRRAPTRRRSRRGRSRRRRAPARCRRPAAAERISRSRRREAQAHRVDQAVLLVGALEVDLPADGRDADRVAVVADARDHALEQVARALGVELAEAQRVEHRDRPGADGEDVAQDPADPGGGALEGLHGAGVVVGLDLEGDRQAVADVHRAGVLPRAHDHARALGRQPAQHLLGVLVGAVLGPHQREHRQLDLVGLAVELLADQLVLGVGEAELAVLGLARQRRAAAPWSTID